MKKKKISPAALQRCRRRHSPSPVSLKHPAQSMQLTYRISTTFEREETSKKENRITCLEHDPLSITRIPETP